MNVLITGANGQLGRCIRQVADEFPMLDLAYTDVEELDITSQADLDAYFHDHRVDYLVNCAAYTAVDKAEEEPDKATLINETAVLNLARCSDTFNFTLVHISTDYVFSGRNHRPYTEADTPDPEGTYGVSKLGGERAALEECARGIVIRTSWLYSEHGNNFARTMLRLSGQREELKVVDDQVGTPTYAGDLARAILTLVKQGYSQRDIFHFSNEGVASWYDFAREIITLSGKSCRVLPITTAEYPLPAPRPPYSLMSKKKFRTAFGYTIPHWKEGLSECLHKLKKGG